MCLVKIIPLIFIFLFLSPSFAPSKEPERAVMVITVDGVINPVAAEYIGKHIKAANEKRLRH